MTEQAQTEAGGVNLDALEILRHWRVGLESRGGDLAVGRGVEQRC